MPATLRASDIGCRCVTHRYLPDDDLLDLHHLRDVVGARLELARLDARVDAGQQVGVHVLPVVQACSSARATRNGNVVFYLRKRKPPTVSLEIKLDWLVCDASLEVDPTEAVCLTAVGPSDM